MSRPQIPFRGRPSRRGVLHGAFGIGLTALAGGAMATGCGNRRAGNGGPGNAEREDAAAVPGGPRTTPNDEVHYPPDYVGPIASQKGPIVAEGHDVTLKVAVPQDTTVGDWSKNTFTDWYLERTGVTIEWQTIGGEADDRMTKVNAMIASGDVPDVFMNMDFTPAQLMLFGQQGLFQPLEGYIDDYGVEIQRVFDGYPHTRELLTAPDGHIYSMPYVNDCYHCKSWGAKLWVYQPWLDELGIDLPETTDDFERMLQAFADRDPSGTGDVIPLVGYADESLDTWIMGSFLYNPGSPWLVLEDGRVDVCYNKAGWREGLRYLHRLYEQGLLARETFTQNHEQLQRHGNREDGPVIGAAKGGTWMSFMGIDEPGPDAKWRQYVAMPTLAGPDGTRVAPWDHYLGVQNGRFVVTSQCENPAVAVMWADGMYELEAQLRAYNGELGTSWRWAEEGETGIDGRQAIYALEGVEVQDGQTWNQLGADFRSAHFRVAERSDPDDPSFETPLHFESEKYEPHAVAPERQLPPLYMTEEQAALTGELATSLENHVTGAFAEFVTGKRDVDDDGAWTEYVETIDRIGLEQYLNAYQEAYDASFG